LRLRHREEHHRRNIIIRGEKNRHSRHGMERGRGAESILLKSRTGCGVEQ
jgi:hypothetical protein